MENYKRVRRIVGLLSGWDCAVVYIDKAFTIQVFEGDFRAFLEKNNLMPKRIMKANLFDVVPQFASLQADFQKVFTDKKEHAIGRQFEFNGALIWLKIRLKYWEEGKIPAIIVSISDKTKEKEDTEKLRIAQEELRKNNLQLEEADRAKDKLLRVLGHDFRTAFNGITGFVDLLKNDRYSGEEKKNFLDILSDCTESAVSMFNNLLSWAQSGDMDPHPTDAHLLQHANDVIKFLTPNAEKKNVTLKLLPGSLMVTAFIDADMLDAILRNLIANAIKFTNPGGNVKIYAEESTVFYKVCIEDDGVGIESDHLKNIFKIDGFRSKGTSGEKGTGLGLTTCRSFIEKNSGELKIHSEPGKGSIFCFTIPKKN